MQEDKNIKKRLTILPLGDSITGGTPYTYRYELYKTLRSANLPFEFIGSQSNTNHYPGDWDAQNEGHSGWTTQDILEHLGRYWIHTYTPDIVLLHLGTNDIAEIAFSMMNPFVDDLTIENSIESLIKIITLLREKNQNVVIYLAKILPMIVPDSQNKFPSLVASLNQGIQSIASNLSTKNSPIHLVDMNSDFGEEDLYDGVHPSEAGATKMAQKWASAILSNHLTATTQV